MISVTQAQEIILKREVKLNQEEVSLRAAGNRILAIDLIADRDSPPFNRSTMDGIAVNFQKKRLGFNLLGELKAGEDFYQKFGIKKLAQDQAISIMTGAALAQGCNQVIPKENLVFEGNKVFIKKLPTQKFFAKQGEDATKNKLLLAKNCRIDARIAASCCALGMRKISCYTLPTVAILATGNEVVKISSQPKPFQIRDINSYLLEHSLFEPKIKVSKLGIATDTKDDLQQKIKRGLEHDLFLISGGVSAGNYDLVPKILIKCGVIEKFHKVSLKPGKPVWFGTKGKTAVFGLPGNPVSVQVCYKLFVEPYLKLIMGLSKKKCLPIWEKRKLAQAINNFSNIETYLPAKKLQNNLIKPKQFKTSGDFFSLLETDGLVRCYQKNIKKSGVTSFLNWR